jgi:hypothetical protein
MFRSMCRWDLHFAKFACDRSMPTPSRGHGTRSLAECAPHVPKSGDFGYGGAGLELSAVSYKLLVGQLKNNFGILCIDSIS